MKIDYRFRDLYVTFSLLIILFLVFLVEVFLGGSENNVVLYKMGAMYNPLLAISHQFWRLFTAQFLHIGLLHIASNAVMIYYMGQVMEPLMGHGRFLATYLLSGVGGNLLAFAFANDNSLSAGASTALFGLFGALCALGLANRSQAGIAYFARQAFALAVINIILDLFMPHIDIFGHLGGLISGFFLAIVFGSNRVNNYQFKWRLAAAAVLLVYLIFCLRTGMIISQ
jgi:rhomboid protease GluP